MKKFLDKTGTKVILKAVLPIIIGGLFSIINWDKLEEAKNYWLLILVAILLIVFIGTGIYYLKSEIKNKKTEKRVPNRNIIDSLLVRSSQNIKSFKKQLENSGETSVEVWSFDKECQVACEEICKSLLVDSPDGYIFVAVIARTDEGYRVSGFYSAHDRDIPAKYCENEDTESFDSVANNKFMKTFDDHKTIFCSENKLIKNMYMFDNTINYDRYYSIPVYDQSMPKHVVARMEIISYNGTKIFPKKKNAEEQYANHFSSIIKYLEVTYQLENLLFT